MSEPAKIKVEVGAYGLNKLVINDQDLTDKIDSIKIQTARDKIPVIGVVLHPGPVEIEGPGIVEVATNDKRGQVVAFLKSLDPKAVEKIALDAMDWNSTTGEAFMSTLIKIAGEIL